MCTEIWSAWNIKPAHLTLSKILWLKHIYRNGSPAIHLCSCHTLTKIYHITCTEFSVSVLVQNCSVNNIRMIILMKNNYRCMDFFLQNLSFSYVTFKTGHAILSDTGENTYSIYYGCFIRLDSSCKSVLLIFYTYFIKPKLYHCSTPAFYSKINLSVL